MDASLFSFATFQQELATAAIGRTMLYRIVTETTMSLARREADEGAPHGTLVLAEEQTAGRGRRGRSFLSPPAQNLYFTLVLRYPVEIHRRLPVVLPVAVATALREEGVDARIKWPNDIWAGDLKLCGMLIDAEVSAEGCLALAGIGINVNGDPSLNPELAGIATSARRELGHTVLRERLLARICNEIEATAVLDAAGLGEAYRALSMVLGREVVVYPASGASYTATAVAIEADGALRVRHEDGSEDTVVAADVSVRPRAPVTP
ncbi:MAG: biotin--[acetyl-CoA-carboxylase] ligase [Tepidiformaceae bacterium]